MVANIECLAGFTKGTGAAVKFFPQGVRKLWGLWEKRRPEMRLLFAGYPQTDLLTELKQWGIKMLFSVFT